MAAAIGGLLYYARHTAERNAAATLKGANGIIIRELGDKYQIENSSNLIAELGEDLSPDELSLFLVGKNGRIIQGPQGLPRPAPLTDPRLWRTTRVRVGEQWLVIALPWSKTETSLRSLAKTLLLFGVFVVLIATTGAWILVGRTLSPIGKLSTQANTATIEGLQVRLKESSQDAEIVGLVATLNALLARLSETAAAKGRFYAAASHELRTPLQALSGHLELALKRDRTPEAYRSAIEEAYQQTRRLIKLTRGLLLLYQLDSDAKPQSELCDLAAICRDTLAELEPAAAERGLRISTEMQKQATFSAPAAHAEVLVRNLLENALRYSDPGGDVTVTIEPFSDHFALRVLNDAVLPPNWDPEPFFEPFARPDASRNAATGGTGLGLAICRAIADVNGWTLTLSKEASGITATLSVPVVNAPDGH
jgi:signal transduction histidine kinase